MCQRLRGFGMGGIESLDSVAARKCIQDDHVDLCIAGAKLPDRSGADFVRWLRRARP